MSSANATPLDLLAARKVGMAVAATARDFPGRHAILRSARQSYFFLSSTREPHQLTRALRDAGLKAGDAVALCSVRTDLSLPKCTARCCARDCA